MQIKLKDQTITLVNAVFQPPIRIGENRDDPDLWALPGGKLLTTEKLLSFCETNDIEVTV